MSVFQQQFTTVIPHFFAEVISPDSPTYREARLLKIQRFQRASKPGSQIASTQTPHPAAEQTVPLIVRNSSQSSLMVATATLELAEAGTMQSMVRFQPGSLSAQVLAQGAFMLIRGLAVQFDLDWWTVVDTLDTIGSAFVQISGHFGIENLWAVPRRPAMSLMLAEIPDLLPPFHFSPCTDVLGWTEQGAGIEEIRQMGLKELSVSPDTLPLIYQITRTQLADDLSNRLALLAQRRQEPDFPRLLQAAMRRANREIRDQFSFLNRKQE